MPERVTLDPTLLKGADDFVGEKYLDTGLYPGFSLLVAQDGQTVHRSHQGYDDDAIFRIYSMTKPITSVAILQLMEQGLLRLHDPVHRFIPSWKDMSVYASGSATNHVTTGLERPVTIQDLLTHTSGLTYDWMYTHPVDAMYRREELGSLSRKGSNADLCNGLAEVPLMFQPGERWHYSLSTDVLGHIVEVVSGRSLDVYFQSEILEPLGMFDTAFWVDDSKASRLVPNYTVPSLSPFGVPEGAEGDEKILLDPGGPGSPYTNKPTFLSGGGGLTSTIDDYARFCTMLLNGGVHEGTRILGRHTIAFATQNHLPGDRDLVEMGQATFSEARFDGTGFGLGFSVIMNPAATGVPQSKGVYSWGGAASTLFFIDPVERLFAVGMTQLMPSSAYTVRDEIKAFVYAALT